MSNEEIPTHKYPPWLYFFPIYVMLFTYALLGRTGFIIVADFMDPLAPESSLPLSEFTIYYLLTYVILFPVLFISQYVFYRVLSKRYGIFWNDFHRRDKALIFLYNILAFILFLWVERIFGVNAPYDATWDFSIGWMHVFWGDILLFFIVMPLFAAVFHGINYAICQRNKDRRQYQFFLVVIGVVVLGTITQDWYWWLSAPSAPWGPPEIIYFYFPAWIQIGPIYIPVIYLIVALTSLTVFFLATLKLYSFKSYFFWCVCPYLLLLLIGNILHFTL